LRSKVDTTGGTILGEKIRVSFIGNALSVFSFSRRWWTGEMTNSREVETGSRQDRWMISGEEDRMKRHN
jgi:hypothetical protein